MISVVIPTMWKFEPFPRFLSDLVKLDVIGEIIIIDNEPNCRPDHTVFTHPKIRLNTLGRNIFVNPAWNLGVSLSCNDVICIMNDDIIVDVRVFFIANEFMDPQKFLVVDNSKAGNATGIAKIHKHCEGMVSAHCGALMFVHKSNWVDIPAGLDICYGDNWIFGIMKFRDVPLYILMDLFYHTPISVTSKYFVNYESLTREGLLFVQLFESFKQRAITYK